MGSFDTKHPLTQPDLCRLPIPTAVDRIAEAEPEATWLSVPLPPVKGRYEYQDIPYRKFANAVNGAAWWLESELGKGDGTQSLAYFGSSVTDIGYPIILLAAVKAGFFTLFNSPRNSIDAQINLFKTQNCKIVVLPAPRPPYISPIMAAYPMRVLDFPSIETLLNGNHSHFPYTKSFQDVRDDPLVSLHTSGSTGLPKPRLFTMSAAIAMVNNLYRLSPDGKNTLVHFWKDEPILVTMPLFHVAGVGISICSCILGRAKIALPPPGPPMSADEAVSLIESSKTTVAFLAPSTLDDIGKQPRLLERMSDMKALVIGGGAISKAAGDAIITKTKLLNFIGLTEIGALSQIDVDPEDWAYIQPSPVAGIEFRHFIGESYELVIVRNEKDFANGYQPTFKLFPDLHEFATHDLFFKHPTKPNHWLWSGRSDDVIVFLNGEKTNPVTFEGLVQSLPQIRAALVTGQGRFEAALLIEPADPSAVSSAIQKAQFIERSWPTIEEANRQCPAHAKVSKSHILFTKPEKPMSRAGKGTVQRRFTIDSYAAEIEALYADVDTLKDQGSRVQIDVNDLEQSLVQLISKTAGIENLVNEEDFFARGMDSLQVIWTTRDLKAGLEGAGVNIDRIAPSIVYINPTVSKLASAIRSLTHESKEFRETEEKGRAQQIEAMIEKYSPLATQRTQTAQHQTNGNIRDGRTVVLTGSTGGLGSYLLQSLLDSKFVSRVYCLNRAVDSEQRQTQVNRLRGLRTQWDIERVVFLTSDFTKEKLGLEHATFQEILANMDIFIHNAWTVDFNLSLASYEPHLQGLKNIIAMANATAHHASLFFISSIASVFKWPDCHSGPVPEQPMQKNNVAQPIGYGESKHAAERILIMANENLNIPVSICRVGQIAGPVTGTKGMWSKQEWLPSLLLSSQHLGVVPDDLGGMRDVDWIPIDELSTILVELALASSDTAEQAGENVFHTVNPSTTTWAALLPTILEAYGPNLKTVSLAAWVKTLRMSAKGAATEEAIRVNPAIKLLTFYEGLLDQGRVMPRFDTRQTEKVSPSLGALGPMRGEWMAKWIGQWKQSEEN